MAREPFVDDAGRELAIDMGYHDLEAWTTVDLPKKCGKHASHRKKLASIEKAFAIKRMVRYFLGACYDRGYRDGYDSAEYNALGED